MTEERIQAALAHYEAQLRAWTDDHQDAQDAYEFEESFVRFTREAARHTFEQMTAPEQTSRNYQKK